MSLAKKLLERHKALKAKTKIKEDMDAPEAPAPVAPMTDPKVVESVKWLKENKWCENNDTQAVASNQMKTLAESDDVEANKFMEYMDDCSTKYGESEEESELAEPQLPSDKPEVEEEDEESDDDMEDDSEDDSDMEDDSDEDDCDMEDDSEEEDEESEEIEDDMEDESDEDEDEMEEDDEEEEDDLEEDDSEEESDEDEMEEESEEDEDEDEDTTEKFKKKK